MEKIGIMGAGQMGTGIAQVSITAKYPVTLIDTQASALKIAQKNIYTSLKKLKEKGIIKQEPEEIISFLKLTTNFDSIKECSLVIECVPEDLDLKKKLFEKISAIASTETLIATNTSSFSVSELAQSYCYTQNFIGLHFMNPVPFIPLVEIVTTKELCTKILERSKDFVHTIHKTAVFVKDSPGFIVNRLIFAMIREAFNLLEQHIASSKDIDNAIKLGANHPMGPLELADFIGLDICLAIFQTFSVKLGGFYNPPQLLQDLVRKGYLGKKTKKGVYSYGD